MSDRPTEMQIDRLRMLSETVLGDPEVFLKEVGTPLTRDEAGVMLGAFHCVKKDTKPLPGDQVRYVELIRTLANGKATQPATTPRATSARSGERGATDMADTKTCTRCGEEKDIDEFYKGHGKCKPCYKEHQKERQAAKKGKKLKRSKPKTSGPAQTTSPPRSEPDPPLSNANGWTIPDDPRLSELEKLRVVLTDALDIDTIELTLDDAAKVSAAMVEAFNQEAADVSG